MALGAAPACTRCLIALNCGAVFSPQTTPPVGLAARRSVHPRRLSTSVAHWMLQGFIYTSIRVSSFNYLIAMNRIVSLANYRVMSHSKFQSPEVQHASTHRLH